MSLATDSRLSLDCPLGPGLDAWLPSRMAMDFGSLKGERKSPPTQLYRGYPHMSSIHFEAPQKPESYRPPPVMDTPRSREEEPTSRRSSLVQEEREYFDGATGKSGWRLSMYQSPKSGKVSTGKEKDRKPLDPPPFVQLNANYQVDPTGSYISSPYYFMKCELVEPELNPDTPPKPIHNGLSGTQVSSLYKLKDAHGNSGAFFTFGDMAVTKQGKFRLKFTLYERPFNPIDHSYLPEYVERSTLFSPVFTAYPARTYPGLEQSTAKTQGFAEQGVRLRIRKESIAAGTRKRNLAVVDTSQEPSRDDTMRRRIAYTSAQMGGTTTLALASPTQMVPTQGFAPTTATQSGHGGGGGGQEGYVWTPELQGLAPFTWNGSPIASAPPWQGHQGHSAQGPPGSQGH